MTAVDAIWAAIRIAAPTQFEATPVSALPVSEGDSTSPGAGSANGSSDAYGGGSELPAAARRARLIATARP